MWLLVNNYSTQRLPSLASYPTTHLHIRLRVRVARARIRGGKEGIARRTVADLIQCLVCGGGEGGGEGVYCRLLLTRR